MNMQFTTPLCFMTLNEEEAKKLKGPCCGVLAVAVCAGVSFSEAWDLIKDFKGVGHQWRGRTQDFDLSHALKKLNVKPIRENYPSMTLTRWVDQHAVKSQMYMVGTSRHIQVVTQGFVIDQKGSKSIEDYWGRRKRVTRVWRIKL